MTQAAITEILGWSLVVNAGILLLSTIGLVAMRRFIVRIHAGIFGLDEKDLGRAYFQYLAQFKIAVIVLNLGPYIALKIVG